MTLLERFKNCIKGPWKTAGIDVQYKIIKKGSFAQLYFQCTSGKNDWKANLDFPATPYKNQPVRWMAHRGFVKLYNSVRDTLHAELEGVTNLEIVGYSHGSALALLAHEDLKYETNRTVETWAFGGPRVLWLPPKSIESRFEGFHNVIVWGDLIYHTPPALFGYKHVGDLIQVGMKSGIDILKHRPEEYLANLK